MNEEVLSELFSRLGVLYGLTKMRMDEPTRTIKKHLEHSILKEMDSLLSWWQETDNE